MERTLVINESMSFSRLDTEVYRCEMATYAGGSIGDRSAEIWKKFGENGICPWASEYGGSGADYLYSVIITELAGAGMGSLFVPLHNDIGAV